MGRFETVCVDCDKVVTFEAPNAPDLETRCAAQCAKPTPWSRSANRPFMPRVRTTCTLVSGHRGHHIGCDDTMWCSVEPARMD
jgi:hypothetical protein